MSTLTHIEAIAATRQGKVRGTVVDGISVFKGVPYAAPPFGANRFRPPQPVQPWNGEREAIAYGAKPLETPYFKPWDVLIPESDVFGEDCLTLNVWSPAVGLAAMLPVMVWIPGGMFEHGTSASPAYDGSQFARDGIVCVTVNYRVGADGFLYLGEGNANRGLLDQVAALEWVRDNIAAFGGDPGNVTVFGQSAGAMSVGTLLSMPCAEGLFRRAIAQSGGAHQVMSIPSANLVAQRLAEKLGVLVTREAMAAVPLDRFVQAQVEMKADLMSHPDPARWGAEVVASILPWQPVVDGKVVPAVPLERLAGGAASGVEVMTGSNLEESNFFLVPGGAIDHIPSEAVAGAIAGYGLPAEAELATYRSAHPGAGPGELLSLIQGDWLFWIPALRLAEAHASKGGATHMYEFAWRSPAFDGRLGACHGLDIAFVFDVLPEGADPLLGTAPPQQLADAMHSAWVAFAKTGDCGWPRYDLNRRATMRFDARSEIVDDPRSALRRLWQGVR